MASQQTLGYTELVKTLEVTTRLFQAIDALDAQRVKDALTEGAAVRLPRDNGEGGRRFIQTPLTALWHAIANHPGTTPQPDSQAITILDILLDHGSMGDGIGITGQPVMSEAIFFLPGPWVTPIIKRLLAGGADITATDALGVNALMRAVERGTLEGVRTLIEAGIPVNHADREGTTALMRAVQESREDIMMVLIDAGADVNIQDEQNTTVLIQQIHKLVHASHSGENRDPFMAVIAELLDKGANPNIADGNGTTPLMEAAGLANEVLVNDLLKAGAYPNSVNKDGMTALMMLARATPLPDGPSRQTLPQALGEIAFRLRRAGADDSLKNAAGITADMILHARASHESIDSWDNAKARAAVYGLPRIDVSGGLQTFLTPQQEKIASIKPFQIGFRKNRR